MAECNPNWTRDELILALDLYVRHRPAVLGNTSAEVMELSEILNRLSRTDGDRSPTHRNANGIAMKLLNFRPFDPDYTAAGKVGLHHTGRGDEEVWREFASDPVRLRQTAAAIRVALASRHATPTDSEEIDEGLIEAPEGRLLTRLHRQRERDRRLVEAKKKDALRKHGRCSSRRATYSLSWSSAAVDLASSSATTSGRSTLWSTATRRGSTTWR